MTSLPNNRRPLPRRAVLRGVGALVALPALEAMGRAGAPPAAPRRLVCAYVPNGVNRKTWRVEEAGELALSPTLGPLAPFADRVTVLSGLAVDGARAQGDGPGDHARAAASFLTAAHPVKTAGADIRAGTSIDQVVARATLGATRFASLELGGEGGRRSGQCDSGYACVYSNSLSWSSPRAPLPKTTDPARLFDRLFGDPDHALPPGVRDERRRARRSVLDFVRGDAKRLGARLGAGDRAELEEYLTALREVERSIAAAGEGARAPGGAERPEPGGDVDRRLGLLLDLTVLALRADATRVVTVMFANEGSNRSYPAVEVPDGHHELSHHGDEPDKLERIARVDRHNADLFARLVGGLDAAGLLGDTSVLYGSAIGDGNRHDHGDLPILVAGGPLGTGRHVRCPDGTPLANLHRALARATGVETASFGDATGVLEIG